MKLFNLLILVAVSLLAACKPARLPEVAGAESQVLSTPTSQPTPLLAERTKDVAWKTVSDGLVVSATLHGGFAPQLAEANHIPDVRIWGDGRIIWVQWLDGGGRRVLEGHLTPDEMAALLQRAENDGFFDWKDNYADYMVSDAATKCLTIEFKGQSKQVCEYARGAPEAFHDLYAYVASGAGLTGKEYVPERGYLTAYLLGSTDEPAPEVTLFWSEDSLGLSLSKAVDGIWVEGEALKSAWSTVNASPWSMVVQDGDAYYQITVQVPGVSLTEPPTR